MIPSRLEQVRGSLRHRLIPALPVPFRMNNNDRAIDFEAHRAMADYYSSYPIGGVAVWAHTGRGLLLSENEREIVLTHWRQALPDRMVMAGVGCPKWLVDCSDAEYNSAAVKMATQAAALGADAVLSYAPTRFREKSAAIIEYHSAIAAVGLPVILFYLYEAAGGVSYSSETLRSLLKLPNVIGIKIATLDSVMTFQDTAALIRDEFPEHLIITGEDRFLGYSLMLGAHAALIGMGTALTGLQCDLLTSYYNNDLSQFHQCSRLLDEFGRATFLAPMEGYIRRMLYTLSALHIIDPASAHDPWGPELPRSDFEQLDQFLELHRNHIIGAPR